MVIPASKKFWLSTEKIDVEKQAKS